MLLSSLVGADVTAPPGSGSIEIAGLTADSRLVRPGYLFVAVAGTRADGARFIADAVTKGAAAVLTGSATDVVSQPVPVLRADEPRRALALMAARYYGAQPETAVAVTGTSGKTSVADFTRQIFTALGHRAASLGTIGLVKPDGGVYGSLTTPDPVTLHKTLAELAAEGVTHIAFEASSHGLDQHRLDGVRLKAAAFTNLGRDHLDYHPTIEAYLAAKLRLFSELLPPGATAVVNTDAAGGAEVVAAARAANRPLLTVGRTGEGLKLERLVREGFAQRMSRCARGPHLRRAPAAARRVPGGECAGRRRARDRRRRDRRARSPRAAGLKGRQGAARDRRRRARRPRRRRLRAQARGARGGARCAAPVRDRQAHLRHGLWRRPR